MEDSILPNEEEIKNKEHYLYFDAKTHIDEDLRSVIRYILNLRRKKQKILFLIEEERHCRR